MALPQSLFEPRTDLPKTIFGGPDNLFEAFEELVGALSPENLTCDGELSRTQINRRLAEIRRDWKALEKKAGFKVSGDEIEDESFRRIRAEMDERRSVKEKE